MSKQVLTKAGFKEVEVSLTKKEAFILWKLATRYGEKPVTHALKAKLYRLISDDERRAFRARLEEQI